MVLGGFVLIFGLGSAEILAATSVMRPRADVAYCIHALSRRLSKTHNWTVRFLLSPCLLLLLGFDLSD